MTQPAPIQIITRYVAGPPGPLAASVATLAALAALPPSGIPWPQGTPAFSQASGGTSWAWYPTGATPPAGATTTPGNGGVWVQSAAGSTVAVPSASALATLPDAVMQDGTPAFNAGAPYRANWTLSKTSTRAVDGVTSVATLSGTGRWILTSFLMGVGVPFEAFGGDPTGATDCSAAFLAAGNALTYTSVPLIMLGSAYKFANPGVLVSGNTYLGRRGVTKLVGAMTPSGVQAQAVLYGQVVAAGTTTLAASPTPGTNHASIASNLAGAIAVGALINLNSTSLRSQTYAVTAISGTGPYTVTLDRPIRDTYVAPGTVTLVLSRPTDVTLDGLGVGGTATRLIEIVGGCNCEGRNVVLDGSKLTSGVSDIMASFDIGGINCWWRNVRADSGGAPLTSGILALESCEGGGAEDCVTNNASGTSQSGIATYDCFGLVIQGHSAGNCYVGIEVTADGNVQGSDGTRVVNPRITDFTFAGLYVGAGSTNTTVVAPDINGGTDYGILTDGNVSGLTVLGGQIKATAACVYLSSGASRIKLIGGVDLVGATTATIGVQCAGAVDVEIDATARGSFAEILSYGAGASVDVQRLIVDPGTTLATGLVVQTGGIGRYLRFVYAGAGAGLNLIAVSGGRCDLCQSNVSPTGTANVLVTTASGAKITVDHTIIANGGGYAIVTEPGTVELDPGCDLSGAANVLFQSGGTCTMVQTGGVAAISGAAGTKTMTFAQHYATSIEVGNGTSISSGSCTLSALANFVGQEFTVKNYNTGSSTTTVFGVVVPVSSTYRIRCNAAGTWEHVTFT